MAFLVANLALAAYHRVGAGAVAGRRKTMAISPAIHAVFGHFQNLNLLALLHDLRDGRTARQAWFSGSLLCPVAHGLSTGPQVEEVNARGQAADLGNGCHFAARLLGAQPDAVLHFVRNWDDEGISRCWLLQQLEEMWEERLADAQALQEVLQDGPSVAEKVANPPSSPCRAHDPARRS
jgi:hypothetical protein